MIQKYITKRDINGNRYTLIVDHINKTYKTDYNPFRDSDEYITIGKREKHKLQEQLDNAGYKWI